MQPAGLRLFVFLYTFVLLYFCIYFLNSIGVPGLSLLFFLYFSFSIFCCLYFYIFVFCEPKELMQPARPDLWDNSALHCEQDSNVVAE